MLAYHGADGIRQARRLDHFAAGATTRGVGTRVRVPGPRRIDRVPVGRDQGRGGDMQAVDDAAVASVANRELDPPIATTAPRPRRVVVAEA